jgi:hypothetical protein
MFKSNFTSFEQELANFIANHVPDRDRRGFTDQPAKVARTIMETVHSPSTWGSAYALVPLVDQYGPFALAPIVFAYVTKSWQIENSAVLDVVIRHEIPRSGFLIVESLSQCFQMGFWGDLEQGMVESLIRGDMFFARRGSPDAAERVAQQARRQVNWIAVDGLNVFFKVRYSSVSTVIDDEIKKDLTRQHADTVRTIKNLMDDNPTDSISYRNVAEECKQGIDKWMALYGKLGQRF